MPDLLPLDGIRVVALVETVPGPLASAILADLGAEVLVVERPTGDPARGIPAVFESFSRNKRFLALDLRRDDERARLEDELAGADVVIVGYRPDVARRLGVDPKSLATRFPAAVVVSVTAAGDDEPEPVKPAHDLSVRALAGQLPTERTMTEDELDGAPVADVVAGTYAAIAALAGLVARSPGRGGRFGVSMTDAAMALNAIGLTPALRGLPVADTMRAPAGYRTFRCSDGVLVAIGISYESHHWAAMCERLGLERWARLTVGERIERRREINAQLGAVIALTSSAEVMALAGAGLPIERVLTPAEVVTGSHVAVVTDRQGVDHLASPIVVEGEHLPVRIPAS
jgi:crotonobetainyl-CoA:carnitine CoA-transferase CaiB-like acyl-CoA transferase